MRLPSLVSMPCFKRINFNKNMPKIKLFLQKNYKISGGLGASPPDPLATGSWIQLCPHTQKIPPLLYISGYVPGKLTASIQKYILE